MSFGLVTRINVAQAHESSAPGAPTRSAAPARARPGRRRARRAPSAGVPSSHVRLRAAASGPALTPTSRAWSRTQARRAAPGANAIASAHPSSPADARRGIPLRRRLQEKRQRHRAEDDGQQAGGKRYENRFGHLEPNELCTRDAPRACRTARSRRRPSARTTKRLATFAHAMSRTTETAPSRTHSEVRTVGPTNRSSIGSTTARYWSMKRA